MINEKSMIKINNMKRCHIKSNLGEMKQVINIILKKNKEIEKVRMKYDKNYKKFKPHINLVYPFKNIDQKKLHEHIKKSIENIKSFKIILKGLKKSSKDYYLYLLVDKGKKEVIKLYKNLNKSLLKDFKNKDMPRYIPHLTLGVFKTKKEIDDAIRKIQKQNLKFETKINAICLLTLNKNLTIKSIKKFKLK